MSLLPEDPVVYVEMNDVAAYVALIEKLEYYVSVVEVASVRENANIIQYWTNLMMSCKKVVEECVEWAKKVEALGAGEILLTSMDCDGTKAGYDIPLTRAVADAVSIPVIASGGAGTLEHFYEGLTEGGADAVLAASLFHYKELEISQVKDYLAGKGVPVRR